LPSSRIQGVSGGGAVVREHSVQILLAEYDRLTGLELSWKGDYGRALQTYLTVISVASGALLFLLGGWLGGGPGDPSGHDAQIVACVLLGLVVAIGEITYLRLMGLDRRMAETAMGLRLIRDRFREVGPELEGVFLRGVVQDQERYKRWSSIRGIVDRALTVSQAKTTVVSFNCIAWAVLVVLAKWPLEPC